MKIYKKKRNILFKKGLLPPTLAFFFISLQLFSTSYSELLKKEEKRKSPLPSFSLDKLKAQKRELKNRKGTSISSKHFHKKLLIVQSYIQKSNYKKALLLLARLEKSFKRNRLILAYIFQQYGRIYLQKENYKEATRFFEKALTLKVLNIGSTLPLMFQLAHLYSLLENHFESLKILNEWFFYENNPSAEAYVLRANNYYQLGYKLKSLNQIEKALKVAKKAPQRKRQWIHFAAVLNYELKKYKRASLLLEEVTSSHPQYPVYWKQLAATYLEMDKNDKALSVLEMAYKMSHLSKKGELLNLVSLYLDQGIPLKAAQILNEELNSKRIPLTKENLMILASSFIYAEEHKRALLPLKKAASLSKDGKTYFYLGKLYSDQENWLKADESFMKALSKGGIKNRGEVHLSLGTVKYRMNKIDLAIKYFEKAKEDKKTKKSSELWINYIKNENHRKKTETEDNKANPNKEIAFLQKNKKWSSNIQSKTQFVNKLNQI